MVTKDSFSIAVEKAAHSSPLVAGGAILRLNQAAHVDERLKLAFRFGVYTAQRRTKVGAARWEDMDALCSMWRVNEAADACEIQDGSGQYRKRRQQGEIWVPLPVQATALLQRLDKRGEWIFARPDDLSQHISDRALAKHASTMCAAAWVFLKQHSPLRLAPSRHNIWRVVFYLWATNQTDIGSHAHRFFRGDVELILSLLPSDRQDARFDQYPMERRRDVIQAWANALEEQECCRESDGRV